MIQIAQNIQLNRALVSSPMQAQKTCNGKLQNTEAYTGKQKVFASTLFNKSVSFKGANVSQLLENYKWFAKADGTEPLKSFLKIKADKPVMEELFNSILKDDALSHSFIWDLVKNPRLCESNYRKVKEVVGDNAQSLLLFLPNNNYTKAYDKFINKFFKDADSIETIIKLRPDWREDVLINKYQALHGNDNFQIGKIPDELNHGNLDLLVDYVKSFMQYGMKQEKTIPPMTFDGRSYSFRFFTDGKTDKNVFGISADGKDFVLKIAEENKKSLNNPYSIGSLALIDNYLTLNNCRNSAPIKYYNHDKNIAIYEHIKGEAPVPKLTNLVELNERLPDFKELGMHYQDTLGANNYFILDHSKISDSFEGAVKKQRLEFISVDNDHVTYSKSFMPLSYDLNKSLPSEMNNAF